jgi:hypothetical protein
MPAFRISPITILGRSSLSCTVAFLAPTRLKTITSEPQLVMNGQSVYNQII